MTPYLRRVEKGVQPRSEVVIGLLYLFCDRKPEMFVQVALDHRPGTRKRAYPVIEDDFRFRSRWLELTELAVALEQDLDALEVARDGSDLPRVELAVAALDLVSADRLIGTVERDHIDLDLSSRLTIGQRAQPA